MENMKFLKLDKPEKVARLLERYIQSAHLNFLFGSGASTPDIQLAGNVEQEINQHLKSSQHEEANKKALEFIQKIEKQHSSLLKSISQESNTNVTLQNYIKFLSSIDRVLFERKNILLPRQANVFTTNYDEFFEVAASQLTSFVLNDGFNRRIGKSDFEFEPELFFDRIYRSGTVYQHQAEIPSVNLIKLHGSISWKRKDDSKIVLVSQETENPEEIKMNQSIEVEQALKKRAMILPNMRKFESTLLDRVYFDLLRLYSNAMDMENSLLFVFGFSFADEHILDLTRRALRNPTAKVVIFAYGEDSANDFEAKFSSHRNVLVIKPEDGQNIGFAELNTLFDKIGSIPEPIHD